MRSENPNLTIISITHDINEAYDSDRIILMHEGVNVLSCTPSELFEKTDIISKYNLDLPFIIELKTKIKELGIDVKDSDSYEEIGEKLCKLK